MACKSAENIPAFQIQNSSSASSLHIYENIDSSSLTGYGSGQTSCDLKSHFEEPSLSIVQPRQQNHEFEREYDNVSVTGVGTSSELKSHFEEPSVSFGQPRHQNQEIEREYDDTVSVIGVGTSGELKSHFEEPSVCFVQPRQQNQEIEREQNYMYVRPYGVEISHLNQNITIDSNENIYGTLTMELKQNPNAKETESAPYAIEVTQLDQELQVEDSSKSEYDYIISTVTAEVRKVDLEEQRTVNSNYSAPQNYPLNGKAIWSTSSVSISDEVLGVNSSDPAPLPFESMTMNSATNDEFALDAASPEWDISTARECTGKDNHERDESSSRLVQNMRRTLNSAVETVNTSISPVVKQVHTSLRDGKEKRWYNPFQWDSLSAVWHSVVLGLLFLVVWNSKIVLLVNLWIRLFYYFVFHSHKDEKFCCLRDELLRNMRWLRLLQADLEVIYLALQEYLEKPADDDGPKYMVPAWTWKIGETAVIEYQRDGTKPMLPQDDCSTLAIVQDEISSELDKIQPREQKDCEVINNVKYILAESIKARNSRPGTECNSEESEIVSAICQAVGKIPPTQMLEETPKRPKQRMIKIKNVPKHCITKRGKK